MYKCDKCGCEHTSRTTCPKCGAPVVIVNQDYLLRRQEWEARQRANLRWKSREEAANNIEETKSNSNEEQKPDTEEMDGFEFINIASEEGSDNKKSDIIAGYIKDFLQSISKKLHLKTTKYKEQQQRIKRHKNEDHSLEVETDEEKASMEKLMLSHIVFKRNTGRFVGIAAAVLVLIGGLAYGVNRFINMDRSDLMYFDGHELISVDDGSVLKVDRDGGSYSFVAYSDNMNSIVMKSQEAYIGWYKGSEWQLNTDYGKPMQQFIFSDTGRYLAYAVYDEAEDTYFIMLYDMKTQQYTCHELEQRIELIDVNDDGRAAFVTLDTTGYSLVLDMKLYVADIKNKYLVSNSVTQAKLQADELIFIEADKLYTCTINDKCLSKYKGVIAASERKLIAEEVLAITDNQLGEELLYITEGGLWKYEQGKSILLAKNVDASSQIFYSAATGFLYYRNMNKLYSVDEAGKSSLVIDSVWGDIAFSKEQDYILAVDRENTLWKLDKTVRMIDTGVTGCGIVMGADACTYIKDNQLIYNDYDKKLTISTNNVQSADSVFASGKYLYFIDFSNVLWKIDKKGKSPESMGYVQLVVRLE